MSENIGQLRKVNPGTCLELDRHIVGRDIETIGVCNLATAGVPPGFCDDSDNGKPIPLPPKQIRAMSGRVKWTSAMVDELEAQWARGVPTAKIASHLGKTLRAVECKIRKLRNCGHALSARRRTKFDRDDFEDPYQIAQRGRRRCLYCSEDFDSSHHGNRICPGCLEDGPFTSAMV